MHYYKVDFPYGDGSKTIKRVFEIPKETQGITLEPQDNDHSIWNVLAHSDDLRKSKKVLYSGGYNLALEIFEKVESKLTSSDPLYGIGGTPVPSVSSELPEIPDVESIERRPGYPAVEAIIAPRSSRFNEVPDGWYRVLMGGSSKKGNGLAPLGWEAHYTQGELCLQPPGFVLEAGYWVPAGFGFAAGNIMGSYTDCSESVEELKADICASLSGSSEESSDDSGDESSEACVSDSSECDSGVRFTESGGV